MKKSGLRCVTYILMVVALLACTLMTDPRVEIDHKDHPAIERYLAYESEARSEMDFLALIDFFSPREHEAIKKTMGWSRLAYSSSHRAVTDGRCENIYLTQVTSSRVTVNCKGPYTFKSAWGFQSDETMHMRVYVKKVGEQWYIGRSGITHTMPQSPQGAATPDRNIGLIFK